MSYKNELQGNNADLQLALNKVRNLPDKQTITDLLPERSNPAGAGQILSGYQGIDGSGASVSGTMTNNGAVSKTLNAGGSYTIPKGYHNGSGKVTGNSLASQTDGDATANDILSGKTAWVDGVKITGALQKGCKVKTGTFSFTSSGYTSHTVTGVGFKPTGVIVFINEDYYYTAEQKIMTINSVSNKMIYIDYTGEPRQLTPQITYSDDGFTVQTQYGYNYSFGGCEYFYIAWQE